jgi:hypothetical protein
MARERIEDEAARKAEEDAARAAADQVASNKAREEAAAAKASGTNTGYKVAPGLSVSTVRGVVDQGESISPRDFVNGQKDVDDLVARKALVKT